jgi:nicotinamide mononucleotide (NMN) deamidase PncC
VTRSLSLSGDRDDIRRQPVHEALLLLRDVLREERE